MAGAGTVGFAIAGDFVLMGDMKSAILELSKNRPAFPAQPAPDGGVQPIIAAHPVLCL
jgi:hypothetical protein